MRNKVIISLVIILVIAGTIFYFTRTPAPPPYDFQPGDILINSDIITPDQVIDDGSVVVRGDRIGYVGERLAASEGITVLDHSGRIYPGLVNAHDHLGYNIFPKWDPETVYSNREEWKATAEDEAMMDSLYTIKNEDRSVVNAFVELRKVIAGTTSVQSNHYWEDPDILLRNLNDPEEVDGQILFSDIYVGQTRNRGWGEQNKIRRGRVTYCIHVSEGIDDTAAIDFDFIKEEEFLGARTLLIHGIPFTEDDFRLIKENNASLGWSPKCNWLLYETTADVVTADRLGVNIALTTDWTRQGSATLLDEMSFVADLDDDLYQDHFSAKDIFRMATVNAAQALGMGDLIGSIKPGAFADIVFVSENGGDPFEAFIDMDKNAIVLVMVGGEPVYGTQEYISNFDGSFHDLSIFGETRSAAIDFSSTLRKLDRIYPNHLPLLVEETSWNDYR